MKLAGVALLTALLFTPAAPFQQLSIGADLPPFDAYTLNGETKKMPQDAKGRPAVFVASFSKAAAEFTRPWLDNCRTAVASEPAVSKTSCLDVRMLEDVPRLFRGLVEMGMRSGLPADLQRQVFLVYKNNDAWRQRLGVGDDKAPYVFGCDKDGRVRITSKVPFGAAELKKVLAAIEASK